MRNLPREFDEVGQRLRTTRIVERSIILGRTIVMSLTACIAIDALIRFPSPLRWVILLGLIIFAVWMIQRRLVPTLGSPSSRVRLALEVEKRHPHAVGRLASGVEFAGDSKFKGNAFAEQVERDAAALVPMSAISSLVSTKQTKRESVALAVVLLLWIGFFVVSPNLAQTGLVRMLAPWITADWPARTGIRSTTFATHHPKQTAVALKADLFRGNPETEPVWVRLRRTVEGVTGAWEQIQLIHQGETRFERLVESGSEVIEFQFLTRDVETAIQRIEFVDAPKLQSLVALVTPPTYTQVLQPQRFDLADGTNNQGRIPVSILQGSIILIEMKPQGRISVSPIGSERDGWLRSTFDWSSNTKSEKQTSPDFSFSETDGVWSLVWTADKSGLLTTRLVDGHGVQNIDDIRITFDVVIDTAPEAVVVDPSADETVLQTARIPLRGTARDDVGLDHITLEATRSTTWKKELASVETIGSHEAEVTATFDLSSANAQPGEVFEIVTVAHDSFQVAGVAREGTRSNPRKLRVLTRPQFEEETRNALAVARQGAVRANERQVNLSSRDEPASAQVRPQTEIGERISTIKSMMKSLQNRLDRNDVQDDATRSLIEAATDILKEAQIQSDVARNNLQEVTQSQISPSDTTTPESANKKIEEAKIAQGEVRRELDDLATLLDRDKDAWAAARKLEKVAEAITQSDTERSKAGASTIGRSRADLSAEESANLDRAADEAKAAAQTARETVEELKARAESVKKGDPARAENLRQAAERGDRESLAAHMEQAERATRENRLDEAQRSSASAMKTVNEMMNDLADDEKARTETLRRRLTNLADALEQLVQQAQSTEDLGLALITAEAADVVRSAPGVGQQAATLSLNASGVADEGRAAGPSAQKVVRIIERGAESEGRAASALSLASPEIATGHENLVRGTALFREALEAVRQQEKKNEDQEKQQRARELAQAYSALRDRQEGVLTATKGLVGVEADRRALVEARRLGVEQENIRQGISAISDGSTDVQKSPTFTEATKMALDSAAAAATDLRNGPPTNGTVQMEGEVLEILRGLSNALSEASKKENDPFEDPSQAAGSGSGGPGGEEEKPLIPPLAELKVIRALQQRIYERTKSAETIELPNDVLKSLSQRQESIAKIADDLRKEIERKMKERESGGSATLVPPQGEPPIKVNPSPKDPN